MSNETTNELVFKPSKSKLAGLFLLAIAMVGLCFFCTTFDEILPKVFGWLGVAFFSLSFYAIPKAWMKSNQPVFVFNSAGIEDNQGGFGLIEWTDIEGFEVHDVAGTRLLGVRVHDEEKYLQRVSQSRRVGVAGNRALDFPSITLGFTGLSPDISKAMEYISDRFAAVQADANSVAQ